MIYEIHKEVGAELRAKGCPFPVVYGPERVDAVSSVSTPRVVLERDRDTGDGAIALNMRSPRQNPKAIAVRPIGVLARVFAQSTLAGAGAHDHERLCDQLVDQLVVALRARVAARHTLWRVLAAKLLNAEDLNARGLERWPGVVYELRFEVDRGVTDSTWIGEGKPTKAIGPGADEIRISTTDEIYAAKPPAGATPETAC